MSSVEMTLVEQARAIEHPLPVPNVSGLYGLEVNGQSYQVNDAQLREIRKRFTGALAHGLGKVQATVTGGMYWHADMAKLRDDQFIVSRISELMPSGKAILAGIFLGPVGQAYLAYDIEKVKRDRAFPDELMWVTPAEMLGRGRKDVRNGHLGDAAADLGAAEASAAKAVAALSKYREGVIEGAGSAADTLEVTRDVSFATVGIIATVVTGGAAAAAITSGVSAAGTIAQQGTEVYIGTRKQIEWGKIGFDAVIGVVTTLIGAKIGGVLAKKLLETPVAKLAAQKFGAKAAEGLAAIVNDAFMGELLGAVQTVASEVWDAAEGEKEPLTLEQYATRVLEHLADPKAFFMNLLQGEITRRLHAKMPVKPGGGHGEPARKQLTEKTASQPVQETAPAQLEQTPAASGELASSSSAPSSEPAPQFNDPVAQAQSVERPEFAGMGQVFEPTWEGPSNLELAEPRTAADHPQEHVPALGEGSGLELDATDRSQGWGAETQPGIELPHDGAPAPELDTTDRSEGFGVEPERRMLEPEHVGDSGLELGPRDHPEGFGAEVDARAQESQHPGDSGLETLDQSKKKNRIYVPPDAKATKARRLAAWREYHKKRAELRQKNPDFAPERPVAEGYAELTKPMKVPGVEATEPTFGTTSGDSTGTHDRKGVFFHELNAAEIQQELRITVNEGTGQVEKVRYRIDGGSVPAGKPVSDRNFKPDASLPVAQSTDEGYKKANAARRAKGQKPLNRGHLAQREVFKTPADQAQLAERGVEGQSVGRLDAFRSTPEALAAADQWTNVVPMTEELNQGTDWRTAENRSLDLADQNGHVYVEIIPEYGSTPERLPVDRTPIPERFRRVVIAPDGTILESNSFENQ